MKKKNLYNRENPSIIKKQKIIQSIADFAKGGDNSDTFFLNKILYRDFRITNNDFMGIKGVTIIDKEKYLSNIKAGIFGGLPRKMVIESIDISETIAMVKLLLKSSENNLVAYKSMVLDIDNEWKLINNLAVIEPKK